MYTQKDLQSDQAYAIWSDRYVIANCLDDLGMKLQAKLAIKPETSQETISMFLSIIETTAKKLKRHDVLEQLYFAGLVY